MLRLRYKRKRRRRDSTQNKDKVQTAADLRVAEEATVRALSTNVSPEHLNKLMNLGILPGTKLILLQRSPSLVFKIGATILAMDKTVGRLIEVDRRNKH